MIRNHHSTAEKKEIIVGDFRFDQNRYQLYKNGQPIAFFQGNPIDAFLYAESGPGFSKEQIYSSVWEDGDLTQTRSWCL